MSNSTRRTQSRKTRRARRRRAARPQRWSAGLRATGHGQGVLAHAGAAAPRLLADRVGLTAAVSVAMGGNKNGRGHDRGRVLIDTACAMADGLDTIRRMGVLSGQGEVFDQMGSRSTVQRVVGSEVDADRLIQIGAARAQVRAHVWEQVIARHGQIPAARMPGGDLGEQIVLRVDANFVDTYSRKESAAKSRGRFGLFPMNVYCDNTGENLVSRLREGSSGANSAADHIEVLTEAVFTQLPPVHRHDLLITTDGAGASHELVDWLHQLTTPTTDLDAAVEVADTEGAEGVEGVVGAEAPDVEAAVGVEHAGPGRVVEYSIGWALNKYTGPAVYALPGHAWQAMLGQDGRPGEPARLDTESGPDTVGQVAEITDRLPHLSGWPPGLRVFVRRMKPLRDTSPAPVPGVAAQLELDGIAHSAAAAAAAVTGWRYELFATNSTGTDIPWLDARHRKHARVEDRIRCGKDTGAAKYPFHGFTANAAWQVLHGIADDLLAWTQLLACDGALAKAEPRTFQDRVLHAPACLTRGSRRRWLNFPPDWPWTNQIVTIFQRIQALPAPG